MVRRVVDVPVKLSARARVSSAARAARPTRWDAHSVALVGTRTQGLHPVGLPPTRLTPPNPGRFNSASAAVWDVEAFAGPIHLVSGAQPTSRGAYSYGSSGTGIGWTVSPVSSGVSPLLAWNGR